MKKVLSVILVFLVVLSAIVLPHGATAATSIKLVLTPGTLAYTLNGESASAEVAPEIVNGRTFVPIRLVADTLGAATSWNSATKLVTVKVGQTIIKLTVGSTEALVNNVAKKLDAAPYIKNGRTLVPLRFIGEAIGLIVNYDVATRMITISSKLRVVYYVSGNLGGKSMIDSAASGIKIVEGGYDKTRWETDITSLSAGDWDVVITLGFATAPYVSKVAPLHPEKKFIIFDTSVDYTKGNLGNVYSIMFKQNQSAFLAGALAAMVTTSKMPLANAQKIIGFIGGMDVPVINDFRVGYTQGAHYIDPDIKVLVSFVGSYADPAKGKELALAQYSQGADIVFNVAGGSGLGGLDAAKTVKQYAIGVDTDQALAIKLQDPAKANYILSSAMKNVGAALYRTIPMISAGLVPFGKVENLGLAENGVGLADNTIYRAQVPAEFREKITSLRDMILSGSIKVDTALSQ